VQTVCATYADAPALHEAFGSHTVCTDEMTGIQALERIAATKPAKPGTEGRREFEYTRHGTQTLIGNFDVVSGEVVSPTVGLWRTEEDFVRHVARTMSTDAQACWVLVADQLHIHQSEGLVRLVARACGIAAEGRGQKGRSGVLRSMASRKEFLRDRSHRLHLVYTPKHTSGPNQIEIWFSILVRRVLRRGTSAPRKTCVT
jgi:hypothetical protein